MSALQMYTPGSSKFNQYQNGTLLHCITVFQEKRIKLHFVITGKSILKTIQAILPFYWALIQISKINYRAGRVRLRKHNYHV